MAHDISCGARRTLTALLLGCTALIASPALAQETGTGTEDAPYRLSPILINADGEFDDDANSIVARELWTGGKVATSILDTPASVSVITEKEVRDRRATTLEEVLSYSPGVHTDYYGTDDRNEYFLVRGFQATTYRDGLTLGSMRSAREEPYAFERTEVIRGGNSTLFGTSDPGGTINFVTKQPRFERFGEVYGSVGSPRNAEYGFDAGDVLNAEGTLAYRLTGKVQDGERDYDHSRNDSRFLMSGLSWQPTTATKLSVVADYLKRENTPNSGGYPKDREYDRDEFFGEPDFNYQNVERASITGLLEHDFGNGLNLRANLRYSDLKSDFGYVYLSDSPARVGTVVDRWYFGGDNTAEELIGNVILQYDRSFDRIDSSTLAGLEFRDASASEAPFYDLYVPIDVANPVYAGAPGTLASPYQFRDNDYETQSLFVQQNLSFDDRFIATVGLRHDWLDITSTGWDDFDLDGNRDPYGGSGNYSETSVRGALTWKVNSEISTYVSYVESVAPASVGVEPERGEQYEVGLKYQPLGTNALISASVYDLTKNNVTVSVNNPQTGITRELVGEQRVRGFDLEGKAELASNVDVIASYSYLKSEVVRSDPIGGVNVEGNEFDNLPNHIASLWVNYTLPGNKARGDMTFGLGARYVGSYFFAISNATGKAESAITLDAAFNYQVQDSTTLAVNITNLLDEQHVVGSFTADYYNPGRAVAVTLRHAFCCPSPRHLHPPPRSGCFPRDLPERARQVRLVGKAQARRDIGQGQVAFDQQALGLGDPLGQLPLQGRLAGRLLEDRREPAFRQSDGRGHVRHRHPAVGPRRQCRRQPAHLRRRQPARGAVMAGCRNVQQPRGDAAHQAFGKDRVAAGMRHLVHQQPGQCRQGRGILDLDRAAQGGQRVRRADGRRQEPQQPVAVDMQVKMGEPMRAGKAGPDRHARGHIQRAQHGPDMGCRPAVAVRDQDMGRHVIQEKHDARVGRQVMAPGARLPLGLPEDADHAVQAAPTDRHGGPDAFGPAGHPVEIAHPGFNGFDIVD